MFEGPNQILLSKETSNKFFSNFMSDLFKSPIKVTGIESDYKGVTIDFTKDDKASEKAEQPKKVDDETLEEVIENL